MNPSDPMENSTAREQLREAMERWVRIAARVRELAESLTPKPNPADRLAMPAPRR